MRMKVELKKSEGVLVSEVFEISDPESFAAACRELWSRLEQRCLAGTANVGELMDMTGEGVTQALDGAELRFCRAREG